MSANHSFEVCIDESGDQGFTFTGEHRSSEWFVLSAIVFPISNAAPVQEAILELKPKIGCDLRKHVHFKSLKAEQRRIAATSVAELKDFVRACVVMIHKPCLQSPEAFGEKNRLYFYSVRLLLERVSWLCSAAREHREKKFGNGTAKVIFSSMTEVSRQHIGDYFQILRNTPTSIDWNVINPTQFETLSPNRRPGLQVADIVAGSFFCADHPKSKSRCDEWVGIVKPALFRSAKGKYRGYGLKLFPESVEKQIAQGLRCPWAIGHFPA